MIAEKKCIKLQTAFQKQRILASPEKVLYGNDMNKQVTLSFNSTLNISKKKLWETIHTFSKLDFELFPVLKMTFPAGYKEIPFEDCPTNKFIFSSVVLLFRFIPIDFYKVRLMKVIPNKGFIEESESLFTSVWKHTRTIKKRGSKCEIRDQLDVTAKSIFIVPFIWLLIKSVFKNRHRRLKKLI